MLYQISGTHMINSCSRSIIQHGLNFIYVHWQKTTLNIASEMNVQEFFGIIIIISILVLKSKLGFSFYSLKFYSLQNKNSFILYRIKMVWISWVIIEHPSILNVFWCSFTLTLCWLLWRTFLLKSVCKSSLLNLHPLLSSWPAQLWIEEIDPLLKTELFTGAFIFLESITTKSNERKLKDFKTSFDELSGWKGLSIFQTLSTSDSSLKLSQYILFIKVKESLCRWAEKMGSIFYMD